MGPQGDAVSVPTCRFGKQFRFEAAHVLPHHPGKCARMHGHSYRLEVAIRGPAADARAGARHGRGLREIERIVRDEVVDELDHRKLNDVIENPTAERIVLWIWKRLEGPLRGLDELDALGDRRRRAPSCARAT